MSICAKEHTSPSPSTVTVKLWKKLTISFAFGRMLIKYRLEETFKFQIYYMQAQPADSMQAE